MDRTVWTVTRATVDDVLFRTKPSQIRKGTKTDNSCLMGEVQVELPNGATKNQKCYGVIQRFYLHFMYPPPKKYTYKLNLHKLKKLEVPWILCADCEWYEELGVHSKNGLVRIQPNPYWQRGCSIHNMANSDPVNITFWPEVPFDPEHFDNTGVPQQNIVNGRYDYSGLTSVLNVINI